MIVTFKIKKWLDEKEFEEVLKISDYQGFKNGYKVFKVNIDKAIKNMYYYEDILNVIREYGGEIEEPMNQLREEYDKYMPVFNWSTKGVIEIKLTKTIYYQIREKLKELNYKFIGLENDKVKVKILPYHAHTLVDYLKKRGLDIVDPSRLFAEKPLPIQPELKGIKLRPYQEEALKKWIENNYRGIIALPTGAGKSIVAITALVYRPVRTLIVASTKEQVRQWREFILKYTNIPGDYVGLYYGEEKDISPITITTYSSGFKCREYLSKHYSLKQLRSMLIAYTY